MEKKNDKLIRTARKYLNESELVVAQDSLTTLCIYWCGKEALYKLNGRNKVSFRDNIEIESFSEDTQILKGTLRDSGREVKASLHLRWFGFLLPGSGSIKKPVYGSDCLGYPTLPPPQ